MIIVRRLDIRLDSGVPSRFILDQLPVGGVILGGRQKQRRPALESDLLLDGAKTE